MIPKCQGLAADGLRAKSAFLFLQHEVSPVGVFTLKFIAELVSPPSKEPPGLSPLAVQVISPPFLGRMVLTAGPAQFGMDLTKEEHGVSAVCQQFDLWNRVGRASERVVMPLYLGLWGM